MSDTYIAARDALALATAHWVGRGMRGFFSHPQVARDAYLRAAEACEAVALEARDCALTLRLHGKGDTMLPAIDDDYTNRAREWRRRAKR